MTEKLWPKYDRDPRCESCQIFMAKDPRWPHESPMQHDLVEDPWVPRDGWLDVRDSPGLGVTVREDVVREYEFS